ncbi:MAG: substrate-binding domain-containing protein, partial [Planctomycetes bacterium]|nr:substrate-binding domain-containing protein [Planctomycetota bacterium]
APQWLLGADLHWPSSATGLARLLFAPSSAERPDALVIADDNFAQAALAGLMSEGVRVGSDLLVIAHANFPLAACSSLPVLHMGFDAVALLREAIARIATMRGGGTASPYFQPAGFADGA